jgi:hypothetical protein
MLHTTCPTLGLAEDHRYFDDEIAAAVAEGRELWRPVPEHGGRYEASTLGRIRSTNRKQQLVNRVCNYRGRLLRYWTHKVGYFCCRLGADGRDPFVHRHIATTFLPNPDSKPTVNHKDGDKLNNAVSNLEWATWSEQSFHRARVLKKMVGEGHGMAKLTEANVMECIALRVGGETIRELAARFGVSSGAIERILYGKTWSSVTGIVRGKSVRVAV